MNQRDTAAAPLGIESGGREPALDGIRGMAIALVLYHHFVIYSGMTRGHFLDYYVQRLGQSSWLGVDLFFVLSGFLITGILYDAKASRHYFRDFYSRRALRIFPLYFAFLAGSFLILPIFLAPAAGQALTSGQAWYWLYLSNFDVALNGWRQPLHFGHFWSLAVEEQYYLVWPFVVYACGRTRLIGISLLCFAGALGLRFLLPLWLDPLANYVLMPTRMDAFAAGAIVALTMRGPGRLRSLGFWPIVLLIASAAFMAALMYTNKKLSTVDPVMRTVGFSTIAIGFAALIAVVLSRPAGSYLRRFFANRVLVVLGKYSYALYIFHQPILVLMRDHGLSIAVLPKLGGSSLPGLFLFSALAFALTMLCALLSWRLIETPFLNLKRHFTSPQSASPGALPQEAATAALRQSSNQPITVLPDTLRGNESSP